MFRNVSVTDADAAVSRDAYAMSHLSAVNLAGTHGLVGVSMHALPLRPSNHIYAASALSQSKVHDADRPSPSAELTVVQPAECE